MKTTTSRRDNPVSGQRNSNLDTEQHRSQCARIYAELRRWHPRECPLWALHELKPRICNLTTRLWEVRHNYNVGIKNRIERDLHQVRSFYLLVRGSGEAACAFGYANVCPRLDVVHHLPITASKSDDTQPTEQYTESLFDHLSPLPRYPD